MSLDPPGAPASAHVAAFFRKRRTGLVTLIFTDLVDSTALLHQLGDQAGANFLQQRRQVLRDLLHTFPEAEEIETAGDSFLLAFAKPSDAVRFALLAQVRLRTFSGESGLPVQERMGIHLGEVVIAEHETETKAKDLYGIQISTCARVMSLAQGGQILLTRGVFDSARQVLKGEDIPGVGPMSWVSHGPYMLKGIEEAVEVCEVGETGQGRLLAPKTSEKVQRAVAAGEEPVLGWRPAVGQEVPNTRWVLEEKLGEGGFGEVWVGRHEKLKERHVFKFCFRTDRVRTLKRELTLFRLLKGHVGEHRNIVRIYDIYLEEPPFYLEEEYMDGKDLVTWCGDHGGVENITEEMKLEIVAQAADALQAAHDAGVIHRDVKPGNILIAERGTRNAERFPGGAPAESGVGGANVPSALRLQPSALAVKLTDFGIGQVTSTEALAGVTRTGLTQTLLAGSTSSKTGTQIYMAPELLAGKPASTRSDIYSLGVVLYQLLVNDCRRPVTVDWAKEIHDPLLQEDLERCFAWNPQERFAGAAQFAEGLRALPRRRATREEQLQQQRERERKAYRRGQVRTAAVAVAVLAVVSALAVLAWQQAKRAAQRASEVRQGLYAAETRLAQEAWEAGSARLARVLLARQQPSPGETDLRGFEWRFLWAQTRPQEVFTLQEDNSSVWGLAFSPQDPFLAVGHFNGSVRLWDLNRRVSDRLPSGHSSVVDTLSFSNDGRRLATSCRREPRILVWDVPTRQAVLAPKGHVQPALWVAFSPDGETLASAGGEPYSTDRPGEVKLWDARSGEHLTDLGGLRSYVRRAAYSPDGRFLAAACGDGSIRIWDLHDPDARKGIMNAHQGAAAAVAFAPDGQMLVSCGLDGLVRFWQSEDLSEVGFVVAHSAPVYAVAFSADGHLLATGSQDHTVGLWEVQTKRSLATFRGHGGRVTAVAFSPDDKFLVSGSADGTVKFWTIPKAEAADVLATHQGLDPRPQVLFSPDGKFLVQCAGSQATIWQTDDRQPWDNHPGQWAAFSPDSTILAVANREGWVDLWDPSARSKYGTLRSGSPVSSAPVISPDGTTLAFVDEEGLTQLWDIPSRTLRDRVGDGEKLVGPLLFLPGRRGLVTCVSSPEGLLRIWDLRSSGAHRDWAGHTGTIRALALSPDGASVASGSEDTGVRLWDVATGDCTRLSADAGEVWSVAFSPDGRTLGAGTFDGWLIFWNIPARQEVLRLKGHLSMVLSIAFSSNGQLLATASYDGTTRLWRAPTIAEIEAAGPQVTTGKPKAWAPKLYAYCMEASDAKRRTLAEEARMLRELGFDGVGYVLWLDDPNTRLRMFGENLESNLRTLDEVGLPLFGVGVPVSVDPEARSYDPGLEETIRKLKGRSLVIGVMLVGLPPGDERGTKPAVERLQQLGRLAAESDLRISVYHHAGHWTEHFDHALRVVREVNHPRVGVNFNQAHWLMVEGDKDYRPHIRAGAGKIFEVTISGAKVGGTNIPELIQPLDGGDFDHRELLATLREIGYGGWVGLQCFGIPGDARDHLQRSINIWNAWKAQGFESDPNAMP